MNNESLYRIADVVSAFIERNPVLILVCVLCATACVFRLAMGVRFRLVLHLHLGRRRGKHA